MEVKVELSTDRAAISCKPREIYLFVLHIKNICKIHEFTYAKGESHIEAPVNTAQDLLTSRGRGGHALYSSDYKCMA